MNSINSLHLVLTKIQENEKLFESNKDITNLASVICNLGNLIIQKSLSCSLLINVLETLNELNKHHILDDDEYTSFLKNVNSFYKSQNVCPTYKLRILTCYYPAVEIEVLSLLKLCANMSTVEELCFIKSAVDSSMLIEACRKNEKNIHKTVSILKKAFISSDGNPAVGYLTFHLCKSIDETFNDLCLLSRELNYLDMFFNFPYQLVTSDEQMFLIKKLINTCFEATKMSLCTKQDLLFYTAASPMWYRKMLDLSVKETSDSVLKFMKFLCIGDDSNEYLNFTSDIKSAKENCVWKFM